MSFTDPNSDRYHGFSKRHFSESEIQMILAPRLLKHDVNGCTCIRCGAQHVGRVLIERVHLAQRAKGGGYEEGLYENTFYCLICGYMWTLKEWEDNQVG